MKIEVKILTVVLALGMVIFAQNNAAEAKTNCQKFYAKYLKALGHKAFATTKGNDPGFHPTTCSFFSGVSSKKLAERKAVKDCNENSRQKDGGNCKVISSK